MKLRGLLLLGLLLLASTAVRAEFSFYLIDNFEDGQASKWYHFGNVDISVEANPSPEAGVKDTITESCGDFSLRLKGNATDWYAGGIGTDLNIDASQFSRLQMDVFGGDKPGKIKIELFDDDNGNYSLEMDSTRGWLPTKDDKWVAEVPISGRGFTRISLPFTAFKLENPGAGDGLWNPDQKNGSGGLLKIQLVLLTGQQSGEAEARIDNLLLTY